MSSAGNYADFDEYIDYQIRKTRAGIKWTELVTSALAVSVFVLGYLLGFTLLDHWVVPGGFGVTSRAVMLGILVVTAAAWLTWKLVMPWFRSITGLYAASAIEDADPEIKSAVLNFIDAQRGGREVPPHILKAMEKRAAIKLSHTDVESAVDRRTLMRFAYALLALVVLFCAYTVFSPKHISIARALTVADESVATETEIFEVTPEDVEVLAGEFVEVGVVLRGDLPETVTAFCTTEDRGLVDEPVELRPVKDEDGRFSGRINGANGRGILQPMTYRIVAGDAETREYKISVVTAPSAVVEKVDYTYPEYMEFAPNTMPGGDIETWEGAEVTIHARTNMPVSTAVLQFADHPTARAEELRLSIDPKGRTLTGRWVAKARSDGSFPKHYRILVSTQAGQKDPDPLLYNVNVTPDQKPEVELLDPVVDVTLPANGVLPLLVQARDVDFKLSKVTLQLRKDDLDFGPEEIIFDGLRHGYRKSITETYELHLRPKRLQPGDVITYYIEARDNKPPLGNKATTPPLTIRIAEEASETEVQDQLEKARQKQQERLEERRQQEGQPQEGEGEGESGEATDAAEGQNGESEGGESGTGAEKKEPGTSGTDSDGNKDGNVEDRADPGDADSRGGDGGERKDKADDDEALDRLIQRMKQRQAEQDPSGDKDENAANNPGGQDDPGGQDNPGENDPGQSTETNETGDPEGAGDASDSANPDKNRETSPTDGTSENTSDGSDNKDPKDSGTESNSDPKQKQSDPSQQKGLNPEGETNAKGAPTDDRKPASDDGTGDSRTTDESRNPDRDPTADPKDGGQKDGGQKDGGQKDGGEKDGGEKDGGQKDGGQKDGGQKDGGEKDGGQKDGGQKDGGQKDGGQKDGGQKDGGQKDGGQKDGGQKDGGQKDGGQKDGGQKDGGQKDGGQKDGGQKDGGQKDGGQKDGGQKDGGQKDGGQKDGGQKDGGQKDGGQKDGGQKDGGQKDGGQKDGGQKDGGQKDGGQKDGGQKDGGQKDGGQKDGGQKDGGQKDGGQKDGGQKDGGQKDGGQKDGGQKDGGQKDGGQKDGGQKDGGQKDGGQKDGGQKDGGQKDGGQKDGGQKDGGQKGAQKGGQKDSDQKGQPGGNNGGKKGEKGGGQQGDPSNKATSNSGKQSSNRGGFDRAPGEDGPDGNAGEGGGSGTSTKADDPDLEDAKRAANLVLKEIEDEMRRGEIDEKMLKELGWTKEDLERFSARMRARLNQKDQPTDAESAQKQRAFEEMLRSLDLRARPNDRQGSSKRDRITEGVNTRRSKPPADLREAFDAYQRSLTKRRK